MGHKPWPQLPTSRETIDGLSWLPLLVAVCNKPNAVAPVRGVDTASWQYNRPAGVARAFQVRPTRVERQPDKAANVLNHDEAGPKRANQAEELRPEMSRISLALLLARDGEGLTGDASAKKVNCSKLGSGTVIDVAHMRHVRPVVLQDAGAEGVDLDVTGDFPSHPFGSETEAPDPSADLQDSHGRSPALP